MTTDANPTFDRESEKAQELQDRADKIFWKSYKSIGPNDIKQAIEWAYRNDNKNLAELSKAMHDDCYSGSLLDGLVKEYLREEALKEAERE